MRILLVNKYNYLRSGTERYMLNLKQLLEARDHTVAVFAMQHPRNRPATYERYFVPYVDFRESTLWKRLGAALRVIWSIPAARRIAHVLDDFCPDLVHLSNIYHQLSPSILVPIRRRGVPIVQTLHDYKLICPNYLLYTQGAPCIRCKDGNYFQAVQHRCLHDSLSWSLLAAIEMTAHKIWRVYERHVAAFVAPSAFLKTVSETFGVDASQLIHIPHPLLLDEYPMHS
ncbi:MAG: glycosyltransferase, partial [Planctomycetota bacterium]